jgi:predicted adenine nucleotide alpha hydrolase (AANH) superfamily ATPase
MLEDIIKNTKEGTTLLLHSCCAPCSSYVINYLSNHFKITVFYYNPNITEESEYRHRVEEQKRLISQMPTKYKVDFIEGDYNTNDFYNIAKGLESCPEKGERCLKCYRLRINKTARLAEDKGFDYFTTTLSLSPLKSSIAINEIGEDEGQKLTKSKWLYSDFKKKDGYKKSIELSKEYNLYRQNYCGCIYSKRGAKDD